MTSASGLRPPTARPAPLLVRTWREFLGDHCELLAASIAYHVLFSLVPLMTLALAVTGYALRDPLARETLFTTMLQSMPLGAETVFDSIRAVSEQRGALSLIGFAGLLAASAGMFGAIRSALNIAWDAESHPGFLQSRLLDLACVGGLAVLTAASLGGAFLLHGVQSLDSLSGSALLLPPRIGAALAGIGIPALLSFSAFLLLYRRVPNVRHRTSDVLPAALFATVLFELGKHGFALYATRLTHYSSLYGVVGAVMLFMLWTYVSSLILLLGAEFGSELEKGRHKRAVGEPPWISPSYPSPFRRA